MDCYFVNRPSRGTTAIKSNIQENADVLHILEQYLQLSLPLPGSAPRAPHRKRPRARPECGPAALGLAPNSKSQQAAGRAAPEADADVCLAAVAAKRWGSRRAGGAVRGSGGVSSGHGAARAAEGDVVPLPAAGCSQPGSRSAAELLRR